MKNPAFPKELHNDLVDASIAFAVQPSDVQIIQEWLQKDDLTKSQKSSILLGICRSNLHDSQFKENLIQTTFGTQKDDITANLKLTCRASMPQLESKQEVWDLITGENTQKKVQISSKQKEAMLSGFYQWGQSELL